MHPYSLYLVTDEKLSTEQLKTIIPAAIKAGVTLVQLREKTSSSDVFLAKAKLLKKLLAPTNTPLIINDNIDIALAVDADGIHLGQSDLSVIQARAILGPNKIIGLSVENMQQLTFSQKLPIDYIGLSAIFASTTKHDLKKIWGVDNLAAAVKSSALPIIAIGGINQSNIKQVSAALPAGVAIVSAICSADCPYQATLDLKEQCTHIL